MYLKKLRKAVAMLELIFAIAIMGIVMMSAPMLITQASNSSVTQVQQEAINAAATQMSIILTRHWDEADTNESMESPILSTLSTVTALAETNVSGVLTGKRPGIPALSSRSFLSSMGTRLAAGAIGSESNDTDDIDDYNGVTTQLIGSSSGDDYKDDSLQLASSVAYANDAGSYTGATLTIHNPTSSSPANATSNIKRISVAVTSGSNSGVLQTNVVLTAFSCNIGTYTLKRRTF